MNREGQLQLEKIVFWYAKRAGSSRGLRDYMRTGLVDFAKKHPHVNVVAKPIAPNEHPSLECEWLSGFKAYWPLRNTEPTEIERQIKKFKNMSGLHNFKKLKKWRYPNSVLPSLQGKWTPMLNPRGEFQRQAKQIKVGEGDGEFFTVPSVQVHQIETTAENPLTGQSLKEVLAERMKNLEAMGKKLPGEDGEMPVPSKGVLV